MSAVSEPKVAIVQNGAVLNVIVADLQFALNNVVALGQQAFDVTGLPVSQGWNHDGDWLRHTVVDGVDVISRIERDQAGVPVHGADGLANVVVVG